jgi:hypothetical protein
VLSCLTFFFVFDFCVCGGGGGRVESPDRIAKGILAMGQVNSTFRAEDLHI